MANTSMANTFVRGTFMRGTLCEALTTEKRLGADKPIIP